MRERLWSIKEYPFHPERLRHYETIFTVGNGYLGTRASFEEGYEDDTPATMIHGIYNQSPKMTIPELVNAPDWTPFNITVDGTAFSLITKSSDVLKPPDGLVLGYERKLHMDCGLLRRVVLFRAATGASVRIVFERFASLANLHLMVQRVHITAIDGSPEITVESALYGDVTNNGMPHWGRMDAEADNEQISLLGTTNQSGYQVAMASQLRSPSFVRLKAEGMRPTASTSLMLDKDGDAIFEKITAIYTSRDIENPLETAKAAAAQGSAQGYEALFSEHKAEWDKYWDAADIEIEGDEEAQLHLRFTSYHILIAAPKADENASIGAKTLSGTGYKGHVFWDTELFMLPPFTLTMPRIARNMLMYRYNRLEGARQKARENGFEGAMFPWESTDTGLETTPQWSDPFPDGSRLRIWTGDNEQHISTDIAYAVLQYWRWTGDDEFLLNSGAEIVLDTAVFWGSRVEERNGRYELTQQIGPDEYHENINNSVFVNRMAVWHLQQAFALLDWLKMHAPETCERLSQKLNISDSRLAKWLDIIQRMYIPFDEAQQIHVQFDGFFDLEYIPVQKYEPRMGGLWGILGHERANNSQVIKQADVVMMMALLGEEVGSREVMLNNWNSYYPRCDHGSSLSQAMHSWVAARLDLEQEAYKLFLEASAIDLEDNKGNVADGIHGAASGGLWQAVVFGFCGLALTENGPEIAPKLPSHWKRVKFNVVYRGQKISFVAENNPV
jgi:trehalose/maltose hydrolase-like predicted phosphorylase